jgi:NAD(P)-dependent dehydrogenase (short-subunit alcohol dehydrogenase family)
MSMSPSAPLSLQDKVVVITGASGGIGAALAREVARRGGVPVLAARREEALAEVAAACGPRAVCLPTDVTSAEAVQRLAAEALRRCGGVDAWVNNVGRGITRAPSQLTEADLDEMFQVNVKSAFHGTQAILPHFLERRRGHLVNVSSMLGRVPFAVPRAAYSASKAFLNALTANLRMELAGSHPDIHVTLFSPGVVATDFGNNALGGGMDSRAIPGAQPVEEVAALLADCLASPRADLYSRPGYQAQVGAYYGAADLGAYEREVLLAPRR